jgi:hypothetical protein
VPDPFLLPELPPSPSGSLEIIVGCRTTRTGRTTHSHPVTVNADWSVTTPHDIALERIAIAMGGYLSCVGLVDHLAPALRELMQRQGRRAAPRLARTDGGRWVVPGPPLACGCSTFGFADVAEAAEHWRSAEHVANEHGVAHRDLTRLARRVLDAHDTTFAQPPRDFRAKGAVRERRGVEYLWDAGLHPQMIISVHQAVWRDGPPLPAWFYLGAMSRRPDLGWIADTLRTVPDEDIAVWLCWTDADLDRAHPAARTGWLQAGVPRVAIAALADGSYTPIDVAQVAHATGRSIQSAAITLAAWHRAACHPTPEDVAQLDQLGVDRWYEPSSAAIDWLCARMPRRDGPTRTQVGLVMAVCGTRAGAMQALVQGIYDPLGAARVMGIPIEIPTERELTSQ